jgi:hypothetical protein
VANVLIGADLLAHFGLLVHCRNSRLLDRTTSLSAPDHAAPTSIPSVKSIGSSAPLIDLLAKFPALTRPTGVHREVRHTTVHHIRTTPGPPVTSRPRRLALNRLTVAKAEFVAMLRAAPHAAPKGPGLQHSTWSPRKTTVDDLAGITEPSTPGPSLTATPSGTSTTTHTTWQAVLSSLRSNW